jgi:hypothetical protein
VFHPRIEHHRLALFTTAVLLGGFALLAWHATKDGIGAGYTDPVLKIRAVDEALYVNASMRMAQEGDWLTPKVFGRLFFQKPPLVYWFSASSIKVFGLSLFTVRLPGLLFGAAGGAAVFLWCARYRSILGGLAIPRRAILPVALLLIFKMQPVTPPMEGAKAMRAYYDLQRDTELIAAETDDDLYSETLPFHVRYAAVDPSHTLATGKPYYVSLGIVLTGDEFLALPTLQATYERRLREWGENSSEPIGTAIMLTVPADLVAVIQARPASDFYLPANWNDVISQAEPTHQVYRYSADRVFLLSRAAGPRKEPLPRVPVPW